MLLIIWVAPSRLVICILPGLSKATDNNAGVSLYYIFFVGFIFIYIESR